MSRISVFKLSFQAWVLHEFRRQILIAVFHQGTEVLNHDLKFNMLSCSHSFHMFFSKRKSRLTRKPSLRPDVLSRYRCKTCKCYALTILSIKCRINLSKRYSHNRRQNCWLVAAENVKLCVCKPFLSLTPLLLLPLPPPLPRLPPLPPTHSVSLFLLILDRWVHFQF